ncbi:MAG: hypothetical protein GY765_31110 [bacterium]|nr:hypothetical protein [bacterium]
MFGSKKKKRFKVISEEGMVINLQIVVDSETGVHYLVIPSTGITPLLDKNGQPVIKRSAVNQESS